MAHQILRRAARRVVMLRNGPRQHLRLFRPRRQRPQRHRSALAHAVRDMPQRVIATHTTRGQWIGEHRIHHRQHWCGGPERHIQHGLPPLLPRLHHAPAGHPPPAAKLVRLRALKRVDRLLDVTHGEHGALDLDAVFIGPRPLAREEIAGQRVRNIPLHAGAILHLIQQQMIDAAIQLELHPGGAVILQQPQTATDQVVIIHQPAARFRLPVRR